MFTHTFQLSDDTRSRAPFAQASIAIDTTINEVPTICRWNDARIQQSAQLLWNFNATRCRPNGPRRNTTGPPCSVTVDL